MKILLSTQETGFMVQRMQNSPFFAILFAVLIGSILFFSLLTSVTQANEITLEELASPDTGEEWFLVGNVFLDVGEYEDAIGSWHNAMILDPSYTADAWYNIGLAYAHAELYLDAILAWGKSIEYNPSFAASYDNIATAYLLLGMPKEALMTYDTAIAIDPTEEKYRMDRVIFIENLKNSVINGESGQFQIEQWNDIGMILYHEGDISTAQKAWEKALMSYEGREYSSNPLETNVIWKAWKNSAVAYMEQGEYTSALNAWLHALELYQDGSSYNDLGYCYIMLEMKGEALDAFENAIAWDPENKLYMENKNNLIELFSDIGDEEGG